MLRRHLDSRCMLRRHLIAEDMVAMEDGGDGDGEGD
jgi:hypothetical protein